MEEKGHQRRRSSVTGSSAQCNAVTVLGTHGSGHSSLGVFAWVGLPSWVHMLVPILLRALLGPQRM